MAQTTVPNSPDIAVLDIKFTADLCDGNFLVDLSPSIFKGTGAQTALGAKVKITNPFDVDVKPYGVPYDILKTGSPASLLNSVYSFPIPKVNTNYQYGLYVVELELTDSLGAKYYVTHNLGICEPNPKDKTKKYGTINAQLVGNCVNGALTVLIDEPPVYKGKQFQSKIQTSTLTYPTGTGITPLVTTLSAFSVPLFEGVHLLESELCVTYNLGGNNYAKVPYKVKCKKNILCTVDLCCIYDKLAEINLQLGDNCSASQKENLIDVTFDALRLLKTIELGASCGEDISEYIEQLEELLQCKCSCSANEGTPVVNNNPTFRNFTINGCNVVKSTLNGGLTDNYQIENFAYEVTTNPTKSFITIGAPILTNCIKVQQLDFNVAGLYTEVKALINNSTEYNFWAGIVNQTLSGIPDLLLTCLGLTNPQWNALTFREKILAMLTKFCGCCAGSDCVATIGDHTSSSLGQTTLIQWNLFSDLSTAPFSVDVYVDNVLIDTILFPLKSIILFGFNDGVQHTYKLIAHCANGAVDDIIIDTFNNAGCNTILAPSLSSNNVTGATCPFNLNSLVTPVAGLSIVWYNSPVVNATTLVPNPAAVTSGTYYAYHLDVNKCSSPASQVVISCATAANCTDPLNMLVQKNAPSGIAITFSSPTNPAPSYLVKRRLASDPDISGSYTTIGTPVFNVSSNKYQIVDNTSVINTLYVYKAESQCTDGGRPSAFYTFANIPCPVVSLTPGTNNIDYSFTANSGQVSRVEVFLQDENYNGLSSQIYTPAFPSPVTGSFTGLTASTVYKVGVVVSIGLDYKQFCSFQAITTLA